MPMLQATLPGVILLALPIAAQPPAPPPPPPPPISAAAEPTGDADLAAEAPVPQWKFEGGGGDAPAPRDHSVDDKIRRSARTSIAGGSIAILGVASTIAGGVMVGIKPRARIQKLEDENGGPLPDDDPDKQRLEGVAKAGPVALYAGLGVFVIGAAVAVIAGRRLEKLRDGKRRTAVAFAPAPMWGGAALTAEVRF